MERTINDLINIVGNKNVLTSTWNKKPFTKGWRYGEGSALAVVKPDTLLQIWKILKICTRDNKIIIMQGANTGLTGGSTPDNTGYDRDIIIINTLKINKITVINDGEEIVALSGSTLYDLEKKLDPYHRDPHSVIGSTSIGATIVGGICNNSGGSLVHRGPAYTQLALYAKIDKEGQLELVNELEIDLGSNPEEILSNLDSNNFSKQNIKASNKLGSDDKYSDIVRDVNSHTPARFNSDKRLLYGVSGSAGKVAVFAVRVNTYPKPNKSKVFYIGTNNPDNFTQIRKDILVDFKNLPRLGDYMHKDCYEAAKKYSKDNFIVIEKLGTKFLPTLFEIKRKVDLLSKYFKFLPNKLSDHLMQFLSNFYPNHLPKRMENFKDKYDHLWIIEMVDDGIEEAKDYFEKYFKSNEGDFFICTENESKKAMLHRYVSAGAFGRYQSLKNKTNNESFSMDIALPRNEVNWFENLPDEIESSIELKLYYGHLFCHVMHQNYIVKNGVNPKGILKKLLEFYNERGAEYPAEHNVGHEYKAKKSLVDFYKKLDPTNTFNPGIGNTSKSKYWN
mgnify:FL=1